LRHCFVFAAALAAVTMHRFDDEGEGGNSVNDERKSEAVAEGEWKWGEMA